MPVTTAQRQLFAGRFGDTVRFIMVQAASADAMTGLQTEMTVLLRDRHRLSLDQRTISRSATRRDGRHRRRDGQVMTLMLAAIASISLVVGGIGIKEHHAGQRHRADARDRHPHGDRRASDVLLQFPLEALMLSLVGCLIGWRRGGGAWVVTLAAGVQPW